jgi:hypothetical protein
MRTRVFKKIEASRGVEMTESAVLQLAGHNYYFSITMA